MVRYFVPTDSMPDFIYIMSVTEKTCDKINYWFAKNIPQTM